MAITIRCLRCGASRAIAKEIGNRVIVCSTCQGLLVQSGNEPSIDAFGNADLRGRIVSFVCQKCQAVLDFVPGLAGTQTSCPRCKSVLTAPVPRTQYPELVARKATVPAPQAEPALVEAVPRANKAASVDAGAPGRMSRYWLPAAALMVILLSVGLGFFAATRFTRPNKTAADAGVDNKTPPVAPKSEPVEQRLPIQMQPIAATEPPPVPKIPTAADLQNLPKVPVPSSVTQPKLPPEIARVLEAQHETKREPPPIIKASFTPSVGHCFGTIALGSSKHLEVDSVKFSPDGKTLGVAGHKSDNRLYCRIVVLHMQPPAQRAVIEDAQPPFTLSSDGKILAADMIEVDSAYRIHRKLAIYDVDAAKARHVLSGGDKGSLHEVTFSADGKRVAALQVIKGNRDEIENSVVHVWDTNSGQPIAAAFDEGKRVSSIALSTDGRVLVTGLMDGTVNLWEIDSAKLGGSQKHTSLPIRKLVFSPDGKALVSLSGSNSTRDDSGRVLLWDLQPSLQFRFAFRQTASNLPAEMPLAHANSEFDARFVPESGNVVTISRGDPAILTNWDIRSGRPLKAIVFPEFLERLRFYENAALAQDSTTLVTCHNDKEVTTLQLWDLSGFSNLHSAPRAKLILPIPVYGAAYSSDGSKIVSAGGGRDRVDVNSVTNGVAFWDAAKGGDITKPTRFISNKSNKPFALFAAAAAADYVAAASQDNAYGAAYELWIGASRGSQGRTIASVAQPRALALSRDGKHLAVAFFVERAHPAANSESLKKLYDALASNEMPPSLASERIYIRLFDPNKKKWSTLGSPLEPPMIHRKLAIAFNRSGDALALAFSAPEYSQEIPTLLRNISTGQDQLLPAIGGGAVGVAFLPDDQRVVTLGDRRDRQLRIWTVATGQLEAAIDTGFPPSCLGLSLDGKNAAVGYGEIGACHRLYSVGIFDIERRRLVKLLRWPDPNRLTGFDGTKFGGDNVFVRSVQFSPDGAALVAAESNYSAIDDRYGHSVDKRVAVWDLTAPNSGAGSIAGASPNAVKPETEQLANGNEGPNAANDTEEPAAARPIITEYRGKLLADWVKLAKDPNPKQREEACDALAALVESDPAIAIPALMKLLGDKEYNVFRAALRAVAKCGPAAKPMIPKLAESLKLPIDKFPAQGLIIDLLGELGPVASEAVPDLFDVLLDDSKKYAGEASYGAGPLLDQNVPSQTIRNVHKGRAKGAIIRIGQPAVKETIQRLKNEKPEKLELVLQVLTYLAKYDEAKEALPTLAKLLEAESTNSIRTRVQTMGGGGGTFTFHCLILNVVKEFGESAGKDPQLPAIVCNILLTTSNSSERSRAEDALEAMKPPSDTVLPQLKRAANDADSKVRDPALRLLKRIEPDWAEQAQM